MVHKFNLVNQANQPADPLTGNISRDFSLKSLCDFQEVVNSEINFSLQPKSQPKSKDNESLIDSHVSPELTLNLYQPVLSLIDKLSNQTTTYFQEQIWFVDDSLQNTQSNDGLLISPKASFLPNSGIVTTSALYSNAYGYGLVDASAAVSQASGQFPLQLPPLTSNDAALNLINVPEAWLQGYTGKDIVVAVVDSGVDYNHTDLNDNIWYNSDEIFGNNVDDDSNGYIDDTIGWDFVGGDYDPTDQEGHGTHIAGIIAAENNQTGITGVAYNAKVMAVRVLDDQGSGDISDIANGIIYAADNGADVINLSLGGQPSTEIANSILYAAEKGSVVVMAAGNSGINQPNSPADLAGISGIAVGAVDNHDEFAAFSNQAGYQPIDYVVAPGVDVLSTAPNNNYAYKSGTSMSTAYVSGVVALILNANSQLAPFEVEAILTQTANPNGVIV